MHKKLSPVSLLSVIGKVFEKIINKRLQTFNDSNSILPEIQFGFRAFHSTSQQIYRIVKHVKTKFQFKKSTGMVLFDIENAFGPVWHDGLVHKLFRLNFPIYLIKLVQHFLKDRTFQVSVANKLSEIFEVPAGLPCTVQNRYPLQN
jgi:hypothetical protein